MCEMVDSDTLQVDDMHVVWPRAAGLDVHKMCITARCACARQAADWRAPPCASSARCPTVCGR